MSDSKNTDPDFEKRKWEADVRLRERELDIKAAEQASQAMEAQARIREHERSRWFNPLVIAIFAAAIAATGNAGVAWINGSAQRELERSRNQAQADLEKHKAEAEQSVEETKGESARILEMIKTADADKAAANLEFLLKAGLVTNETRKTQLYTFLKERPRGQGPTLPAIQSSTARLFAGEIHIDGNAHTEGKRIRELLKFTEGDVITPEIVRASENAHAVAGVKAEINVFVTSPGGDIANVFVHVYE